MSQAEKTDFQGRMVGVVPLETLAAESGLSVMRGILDGRLAGAPISRTLDIWLSKVGEGLVEFRGLPNENHLNPIGSVHGGWTGTIMDSALACAVMTTLAKGEGYTTVEFKVNLVRPILPGMGEVVCEGKLIHRGRTIATSEAFLRDQSGKLLAHGTETCAIFPVTRYQR